MGWDSVGGVDVYNFGVWVLLEGGMVGIVMLLQCYGLVRNAGGTRTQMVRKDCLSFLFARNQRREVGFVTIRG